MRLADIRRLSILCIALATFAGGLALIWRSLDHVGQLSTGQILAIFGVLLLPPLTCAAWLLDRRTAQRTVVPRAIGHRHDASDHRPPEHRRLRAADPDLRVQSKRREG